MKNDFRSCLVRVRGRVQGVGFRYSVRQQARALGLRGWVRNLGDGSVEVCIQGSHSACNAFLAWCRDSPGYSLVEGMDLSEGPIESQGPFHIRH